MGKRKLNGTSFFQCDWTGFPLKQAYCYMPSWAPTGKLQKKGSYCNWEAVVAHAAHLLARGEIDAKEHERVMEHVASICGTVIEPAPHYDQLAHTKGTMNAEDFHKACVFEKHPITAVKISPNGDVFEVLLTPDPTSSHTGRYVFSDYLHKPFAYHGPPSSFHSMRKKGSKAPDRDLTVWYYNVKELPHNPAASNLFKMQLYGDVLLVLQSREQSFMPRERYVSFTKTAFDEQFSKKRKRTGEVHCLGVAAYAEIKESMQKQLNRYEAEAAKAAVPPAELQRVQREVPRADGKSLAAAVRARAPSKLGPLPPAPILLSQEA